MPDQITLAAQALRDATTGARLVDLPADLVPQTESAAYDVQEAVIGATPIAGWKVAAIAVPNPLTAGALSQDLLLEGTIPAHLKAPEIEVEIAIRIARDLLPRATDYTADEVLAALGSAHAAIEIVESRFVNRKAVSPLSALADSLSSSGFVIGSGVDDWHDLDFTALKVTLSGNAVIAEVQGNATVDQTIKALTWLANHASRRGCGLKAGQFVITGARIGPIFVDPQELTATIERVGEVRITV